MEQLEFGRRDSDKEIEVRLSIQETKHNHLENRVGKMEAIADKHNEVLDRLHESVNDFKNAVNINTIATQNVATAITQVNDEQKDLKTKVDEHTNWRSEVIGIWITLSKLAAIIVAVGGLIGIGIAVLTYLQ